MEIKWPYLVSLSITTRMVFLEVKRVKPSMKFIDMSVNEFLGMGKEFNKRARCIV